MLILEIQEGKDAMKYKEFVGEMKAQAACSIRIAEASKVCGQDTSNKGATIDQYCGDSWFTSVETCLQMIERGYEYGGVIKNCHAGFPRFQLEALMSDWPGGSYLVMTSDNLVATGYKYNSRKVICFLSSKNFGPTTPGNPYQARFIDQGKNLRTREVERPAHMSKYFECCNAIDSHNHARQGILSLEEHWLTQCPWFRLVTTFVGLTVTDMWKAVRYGMEGNSYLSSLSMKDFAGVIAMDLLHNKQLSSNNRGGKRAIQRPMSVVVPVSRSSDVSELPVVSPAVDSNGYVSEFPPIDKNPAIGKYIDGEKVVEVQGKHVFVDKEEKAMRWTIFQLKYGGKKNVHCRRFCLSCQRYCCQDNREKGDLCTTVHSAVDPVIQKNDKAKWKYDTNKALEVLAATPADIVVSASDDETGSVCYTV